MRASCSFTVETTDTSDPEWEGGAIQRNRLAKVFTGDLVGTSVVEATMFGLADGSAAAYVGIERFEGTVAGAKGSFVLVHRATIVSGEQVAELTILPGTGTDELEGITGTADLLPDHNLTLHYELG